MKRNYILRTIAMAALMALALPAFSQSFTTGGYQGGTHGNIKVTTWSGAEDNDWSNPDNWCPAVVPDAAANVVVPASASVMPEVKSAGLSCKSLKLEPGAEVTIKDGFVLTVNGQDVD
jgi:hypothetical protein